MGFSEFEIEEFIWANISNQKALTERGLNLPKGMAFYRQLELPGCGRPDIVGVGLYAFPSSLEGRKKSKYIGVNIYELKKGVIGINEVAQICKYVSYVDQNKYFIFDIYGLQVVVDGYIIGASITKDALAILQQTGITFITFQFAIDKGIIFNEPSSCPLYVSPIYPDFAPDDFPRISDEDILRANPVAGRLLKIRAPKFTVENPN